MKPKKKRVNCQVYIPASLYDEITKRKQKTGVPIARFVRDTLKAALAK